MDDGDASEPLLNRRFATRSGPAPYSARLAISSDVEFIAPVYGHQRETGPSTQQSFTRDALKPHEILDQEIESFGYDPVQNPIFIEENIRNGTSTKRYYIEFLRHLVLFLIGLITAASASLMDYLIELISEFKYRVVSSLINQYHTGWFTAVPGFTWCFINMFLVSVSSLLVVFLAPVAAGSGIPQIKCYLNGLNIPRLMRCLTMFVKGAGVVLAVSGGLAVGKEGPMIHIGSVVAAGISQGRVMFFRWSLRSLRFFRNDRQKRDFVSAGAAAGVAAAFGAPVGGLLFALEEGASFVYQRLTWTILFASMVSMFVLALLKTLIHTHSFNFTPGGLASFGAFTFLDTFSVSELLLFLVMGAFGGVSGALFVKANALLTQYRQKYVTSKYGKVIEVVLVSFLTTSVGFALIWLVQDCGPVAFTTNPHPLKLMCADNEFNTMSALLFNTPERSLRILFHEPPGTFNVTTLLVFFPVYYIIACLTYGLSVSSGLFIPALLIGASWGRVIGNWMYSTYPETFPHPGKFALIGAAAQLGGVVRMTLSLTVILMEATGNVIVGLPLLMTLIVAKYTGDYLSEGIYDEHIGLSSMALLPWEPDPLSSSKRAYDVMCSPVVYLEPVMHVRALVEQIRENLHHGFPIVEGPVNPARFSYGTLVGVISSEHLAIILKHRIFLKEDGTPMRSLEYADYDSEYPSYAKLHDVLRDLTEEDLEAHVNLRPYMCEAPYSVPETMTMNRVYHLFRLLGLRHLPVVDSENQVRGMITRKDLCRFRFERIGDELRVEELTFSKKVKTKHPGAM
ncbi:H(+)/Cl(-) exchange transporter 7 [Clonorchis sinensis]|uniref:Chloride channel protein n=2 Tax=Clonorchis sinensis TaxID=79923 RepID=A0A3R7CAF6_CLOSI|nr:H(+)/Cl(-) exchange transporter 7 [Clonorchis sinensis]